MDHDRPSSHIRVRSSLGIVLAGNILAAGLGALALWLVSRHLTVAGFGLFSLALTVIRAVPVFTTLGLDTTTMRFASSYLKDGRGDEAAQAIRAMSSWRLFSGALLAVLIFVLAGPLAEKVFRMPALAPLLRLASIGVLGASQFNYFKSILWAYQAFRRAALIQILFDAFKLCGVLVLPGSIGLNPFTATCVWSAAPLFGWLVATIGPRRRPPAAATPPRALLAQLLGFTKWVFASELCRACLSSADLFLVAALLGKQAAGIYGLAAHLTYVFPVLFVSLKAVLVPHVSRFRSRAEFETYVRRILKLSALMGLTALAGVFLFSPLIPKIFGSRYAPAIPVFNILFLAHCVNTTQMPLFAVFYGLHRPRLLAFVDMGRLIAVVVGTCLGIPSLGVLAPPAALLTANLASSAFLAWFSQRLVRLQAS